MVAGAGVVAPDIIPVAVVGAGVAGATGVAAAGAVVALATSYAD